MTRIEQECWFEIAYAATRYNRQHPNDDEVARTINYLGWTYIFNIEPEC